MCVELLKGLEIGCSVGFGNYKYGIYELVFHVGKMEAL
jgi:hypothetical protein